MIRLREDGRQPAPSAINATITVQRCCAQGKVLVAGGFKGYRGAELYDPAAGSWTRTASLAAKRFLHTATLLSSGKVLVAGGVGRAGSLSSAELYDQGLV
jgi:hypothetical protein